MRVKQHFCWEILELSLEFYLQKVCWLCIASLPSWYVCVCICSCATYKEQHRFMYLMVECTFECFLAGEQGFPNCKKQIAFVSNFNLKLMPPNWTTPSLCTRKWHICCRRFLSTCALLSWIRRPHLSLR